jgi:hypothetical protein
MLDHRVVGIGVTIMTGSIDVGAQAVVLSARS